MHPSKEELSGFLLGKLPAEATEAVAEHLERCAPCQETVVDLEAHQDTLLHRLQQIPAASVPTSPQVQQAIAKVAALASPTSGEVSLSTSTSPSLAAASAGAAVPTREQFLTTLRASGIFDAEYWSTLETLPAIAQAADGAALARALVQTEALTKFQATLVYRNKPKGLLFGDYVVLDLLGEGGMGQVFKARHRSMDRIVALKVLAKSAVNSPDAVKRFQREAKAAAKLIHPNIVTAFDAGQQDGTHFLIMEYIAGSDLSAIVKRDGPLPVDKVISYMTQAARGLAFAHAKGVVHRDIKPANLLVDHEGTVRILDMGLARLDGDVASRGAVEGLTQTGQVMGTVDYMAPEQAFDTSKADAKADVYSLGCTLYRLVTGQNLFGGDTLVQKILAHRETPAPSLLPAYPQVSPQLDAIYRRMVAKRPQDRPAMSELVSELEQLSKKEASTQGIDNNLTAFFETTQASGFRELKESEPAPRAAAVKPQAGGSGRKQPPARTLIAAGVAGAFLFLALGVWVIVRDKDGNEIARVKAPDGSSATIMQAEEPPAVTPIPSGRPAPTISQLPSPSAVASALPASRPPVLSTIIPPAKSAVPSTPLSNPPPPATNSQTSPIVAGRDAPIVEYGDLALYLNPAKSQSPSLVVDSLHYDGSTPLTIETWCRPAITTGLTEQAKASKTQLTTSPFLKFAENSWYAGIGINYLLTSPDNPVPSEFRWGPGGSVVSKQNATDSVYLASYFPAERNDSEHHIAFVVDRKPDGMHSISFWIDGKRVMSESQFQLIASPSAPFKVGPDYAGTLNEIRVSKVARYAADFIPKRRFEPDADTLALYHCDEGSGDKLVDSSGKSHHGKLTNVSWVSSGLPDGEPPIAVAAGYYGSLAFVYPSRVVKRTTTSDVICVLGERIYTFVQNKEIQVYALNGALAETIPTPPEVNLGGIQEITALRDGRFALLSNTLDRIFIVDSTGKLVKDVEWKPKPADKNSQNCHAVVWNDSLFVGGLRDRLVEVKLNDLSTVVHPLANFGTSGLTVFENQLLGQDDNRISTWSGSGDTKPFYQGSPPFEGEHQLAIAASDSAILVGTRMGKLVPDQKGRILRIDGKTKKLESVIDVGFGVTKICVLDRPTTSGSLPTATTPKPAVAPFDATKARSHQEAWASHLGMKVETENSVGAKMILIPPGEFLMGSTDEQIEAGAERALDPRIKTYALERETPQHRVVITKPFLMGATEVTVGQLKKFCASGYRTEAEKARIAPSPTPIAGQPQRKISTYLDLYYPVTDESPAACITWNDADAFCRWLSEQEKVTYRLPTEAEWEYACRAGTTTPYSFGENPELLLNYGWLRPNSTNMAAQPHFVGTKPPNPFGLHDMHTNLSEWCRDHFDPQWYRKTPSVDPSGPGDAVGNFGRVVRGGYNYNGTAYHCRSASRSNNSPSANVVYYGFRYVRALDAPNTTASANDSNSRTSPKSSPLSHPPLATAPFNAVQARTHQEFWAAHLGMKIETENSVGAKMVLIPPGEFLMGSSDQQVTAALKAAEEIKTYQATTDRIQSERPQHNVVITKPFLICATEVTTGQFKRFVAAKGYKTDAEKKNASAQVRPSTSPDSGSPQTTPTGPLPSFLSPGWPLNDDLPAAVISWNDAVAFCDWLSETEKVVYRLPTEAEWEFACRAGTTTQYSFGDDVAELDKFGWYFANSGGKAHPVGSKLPNSFGLFDMHGNLYEYCRDFFHDDWYAKSPLEDPSGAESGTYRVMRGGVINFNAIICRSAHRGNVDPLRPYSLGGFRVVRELDVPTPLGTLPRTRQGTRATSH